MAQLWVMAAGQESGRAHALLVQALPRALQHRDTHCFHHRRSLACILDLTMSTVSSGSTSSVSLLPLGGLTKI